MPAFPIWGPLSFLRNVDKKNGHNIGRKEEMCTATSLPSDARFIVNVHEAPELENGDRHPHAHKISSMRSSAFQQHDLTCPHLFHMHLVDIMLWAPQHAPLKTDISWMHSGERLNNWALNLLSLLHYGRMAKADPFWNSNYAATQALSAHGRYIRPENTPSFADDE